LKEKIIFNYDNLNYLYDYIIGFLLLKIFTLIFAVFIVDDHIRHREVNFRLKACLFLVKNYLFSTIPGSYNEFSFCYAKILIFAFIIQIVVIFFVFLFISIFIFFILTKYHSNN